MSGLAAGEGLHDEDFVAGREWVGEGLAVGDRLAVDDDGNVRTHCPTIVEEVAAQAGMRREDRPKGLLQGLRGDLATVHLDVAA